MSQLRVMLSVGHVGRPYPKNPRRDYADYGAVSADGLLREADICHRLALMLAESLRKLGHIGVVNPIGHYPERWQISNRGGFDIFNDLHLNAVDDPKVNYGRFFYDPATRAGGGDALAQAMAAAWAPLASQLMGEEMSVRAEPATESAWPRVYGIMRTKDATGAVVAPLKAVQIVSEPGFLSHPRFVERVIRHPEGLAVLHDAHLAGYLTWHNARQTA